ncbi:hypothetical protein ACFQZQ_03075 [Lysobacter koreensis]|uniref:Uncharacterized protein n=1 Tax=Lysobacter koreensis TaxID=266122 RepID=A0ABW2YP88_9GAMM
MQITAATWIDATTINRAWDKARDTSRIRGAFSSLALTRDTWPAPRHFLDALPPSSQLALAGDRERPVDPPELVKELDAISRGEVAPLRSVDELRRELSTTFEPVGKLSKGEAAAELATHYSDRKSAAAGDA